MRHFTTYASNDSLILELINDPRYEVRKDGTVWRKCGGKLKQTGLAKTLKRGKQYRHLSYKRQSLLVHRIIYAKFIGKLNPRRVVNHIDADSLNNKPSNLELVTQSENINAIYS